ncbi:MAG: hypothetical protein LBJ84_03155 [Oscillospiraceae bacterium]|jgi:hypothetical protein|nr:hypothetical protein [Oscillospiraceae bacterium]
MAKKLRERACTFSERDKKSVDCGRYSRAGRAAAAVFACVALMSACGSGTEVSPAATDSGDPSAAAEVSAPPVQTTLAEALAAFGEFFDAREEEVAVDFSDEAQVSRFVEKRNGICERLIAIDLGAEYEQTHTKLRSGAEKMMQYLGELPAFCLIRDSGTAEAEAKRSELTAIWSSANSEIESAYDTLAVETQIGAAAE